MLDKLYDFLNKYMTIFSIYTMVFFLTLAYSLSKNQTEVRYEEVKKEGVAFVSMKYQSVIEPEKYVLIFETHNQKAFHVEDNKLYRKLKIGTIIKYTKNDKYEVLYKMQENEVYTEIKRIKIKSKLKIETLITQEKMLDKLREKQIEGTTA